MKKKNNFALKTLSNMLMILVVFIIMCINVLAVSLSLQCNRNMSIFVKIASALFAFMFGIFYLVVNFYYLRIYKSDKICDLCNVNIFNLF